MRSLLPVTWFLAAVLIPAPGRVTAQERSPSKPAALEPAGGGSLEHRSDRLSPLVMDRIGERIIDSRDDLLRRGRLPAVRRGAQPSFIFPLAPVSDPGEFSAGFEATTNFVDHNASFPDLLEDYNCGTRTYDTASGYNHRGTDLALWPFPWLLMDTERVEVVAAAPGTIITKSDGAYDRNCSFNEDVPNYVTVEHADGSIALYLHMKNGSLTSKSVGETVVAGEYLGLVGSSGSSTAPHLHFEVWDGGNPSGLIDPFSGLCNGLNGSSWWQTQPDYYDSRINLLATHSAAPVFPSCPTQETPNFESFFERNGQSITVYTAAYFRDERASQEATFWLLRPDGSTFSTWTHTAQTTYAASYWYWFWTISAGEPEGRWTLRVDYEGEVTDRPFYIDPLFASSFESSDLTDWNE